MEKKGNAIWISVLFILLLSFISTTINNDATGNQALQYNQRTSARTQTPILFTIKGDNLGDSFGNSVSQISDINGDSFPEMIIGIPKDSTVSLISGRSKIISGKDKKTLGGTYGNQLFGKFGESTSNAGDVNNDNYDDFIIGAPFESSSSGTSSGNIYLYSGKDGSLIYSINGPTSKDLFGASITRLEDINNDGINDLAIGAPGVISQSEKGGIYVLSGEDGSIIYYFSGDKVDDLLGWSIDNAGDVNNDGVNDIIAGAIQQSIANPGDSEGGYARVYSGKDGSILYTFLRESIGDSFGYSVAGIGDINNDGFDDMAVGANLDGTSAISFQGSVTVYSGKDGNIIYKVYGTSNDDGLGDSLTGIQDINNDGIKDFVAGAPTHGLGPFTWKGYARVYSGKDGAVLYTFYGDQGGDRFGDSLNSIADINNDGFDDLLIGATQFTPAGSKEGYVRGISLCKKTSFTFGAGLQVGNSKKTKKICNPLY